MSRWITLWRWASSVSGLNSRPCSVSSFATRARRSMSALFMLGTRREVSNQVNRFRTCAGSRSYAVHSAYGRFALINLVVCYCNCFELWICKPSAKNKRVRIGIPCIQQFTSVPFAHNESAQVRSFAHYGSDRVKVILVDLRHYRTLIVVKRRTDGRSGLIMIERKNYMTRSSEYVYVGSHCIQHDYPTHSKRDCVRAVVIAANILFRRLEFSSDQFARV